MRWIAASIFVLLAGPATIVAQEWSVDLFDIRLPPDDTRDRIRAESVRFLPDGKTIASAGCFYRGADKSCFGEVVLRNAADKTVTATLRGSARSYAVRAGALAVTPSGKLIAAAGWVGTATPVIDVFDLATNKLVHTLKGDPGFMLWLAYSPDSKLLAAMHFRALEVWEGDKLKWRRGWSGDTLAFAPDGSFLAVGREGGAAFLRVTDGAELGRITGGDAPAALTISPDGKSVALGVSGLEGGPSPIGIWRVKVAKESAQVTTQRLARLDGHREHTYSLAFSPDSKLLATANADKTARIWDMTTMQELASIKAHTDFVYDVAFAPNGKSLLTLGRDSLKLWTLERVLPKK